MTTNVHCRDLYLMLEKFVRVHRNYAIATDHQNRRLVSPEKYSVEVPNRYPFSQESVISDQTDESYQRYA